MATDLQPSETLALHELDSETAKFYEVVDGHIVENPPMGALESLMANDLSYLMGPFARSHKLGTVVIETLFLLDPTRGLKRRPDLAFVSTARWPLKRRIPRTECWEVVPDLVAEFISVTNTADEAVKKIDEYFQAGVIAVWVLYPGTSKVYVYDSPTQVRILQVGDDLEGGAIVPGFRVALSVLFQAGAEGSE
ncbi:MAG: Uma2 family endonuclease [Isosphaeraceae bacterium]